MQEKLQMLTADKIMPNPLNPRKSMGDLDELRRSIIAQGLIQPMVVRSNSHEGMFELIAGERRLTAIKEAIQNKEINAETLFPVIIREFTDEEAVQAMFIENLLREGLSDYDQAEAFHKYLQHYNAPEAIHHLAEATGIGIHYIQKREKVMNLPASILLLWKEEKLTYGHLEQLLRLSATDAEAIVPEILEKKMSVSALKAEVVKSKADLSTALFNKEKAGCLACQRNSSVQQGLFGSDYKTDKVVCLDPKCFFEKQRQLISDNWERLAEVKKHKTNAVIFVKQAPENVIFMDTKEKCFTCPNYVTFISEYAEMLRDKGCNGDPECYKGLYPPPTPPKAQKPAKKAEKPQKTAEEALALKDENCGKEMTAKFLIEALSQKMQEGAPLKLENMRIILFNLIASNKNATTAAMGIKKSEFSDSQRALEELNASVPAMNEAQCAEWLLKITVSAVATDALTFSLNPLITFGKTFDILANRDFVMTEEYLKRKTKDQLIKLSAKFDILKGHTSKELSQFKKTVIIEKILTQNLQGMVPDDVIEASTK